MYFCYISGVKGLEMKKINLVVFDFDGTISSGDTNVGFGRYCFAHSVRPWLFLPIMGVAFIIKKIAPKCICWRQMMRMFLTNNMIKKYANDFIKIHKKNRFGWVNECIAFEKSKPNTRVILISASSNFMIPKLVDNLGFDAVIHSEMDKKYPWKFKFFCYGPNKVIALNEWLKKNNYSANFVRSYSDNISDVPIMELANEQVWIDPKTGIRK